MKKESRNMSTHIAIAFRRMSWKSLTDIIISFATKSEFVHTELIIPAFGVPTPTVDELLATGHSYTSTPGKGVTCEPPHRLKAGDWDVLSFKVSGITVERIRAWCDSQVGEDYDGWAALACLWRKLPQDPDKRTCIEVVAGALHEAGRPAVFKGFESIRLCTLDTPRELYEDLRPAAVSIGAVRRLKNGALTSGL